MLCGYSSESTMWGCDALWLVQRVDNLAYDVLWLLRLADDVSRPALWLLWQANDLACDAMWPLQHVEDLVCDVMSLLRFTDGPACDARWLLRLSEDVACDVDRPSRLAVRPERHPSTAPRRAARRSQQDHAGSSRSVQAVTEARRRSRRSRFASR